MKKLITLLLMIPILAFGRIGDTRQKLVDQLNPPKTERSIGLRTGILVFSDGVTLIVVGTLDGISVIEYFFPLQKGVVNNGVLDWLLTLYGQKWFPVPDIPGSHSVINDSGTIIVSEGIVDGVPNVVTVSDVLKSEEAYSELKKGMSQLRL